jgi:hypothetical protein
MQSIPRGLPRRVSWVTRDPSLDAGVKADKVGRRPRGQRNRRGYRQAIGCFQLWVSPALGYATRRTTTREAQGMKNRIVILLMVIVPVLAAGGLYGGMWIGMYRASQVPSLHTAAGDGDLQEVKRLLGTGEPVNLQITGRWETYEGQTPLMWAALHGHVEVVRFLLDNGADPSIRDANGQNAEYYAGNELVQQVLEQHM